MAINVFTNIENILLECSESEKKIALFILNNPRKVLELPVKEVAAMIGTSTASISRFTRKLGIRNYKELKQYLIVEIVKQEKEVDKFSIEDKLSWDNSYEDMRKQMLASINAVCKGTLEINSVENLMKVVKDINNANIIYFFALGSSVLPARDLQHKLMRLGKRCIFLEDNNYGIQNLIQADERDMLIIVSFDGSQNRVIGTAKKAKNKNILDWVYYENKFGFSGYVKIEFPSELKLTQEFYCDDFFNWNHLKGKKRSFEVSLRKSGRNVFLEPKSELGKYLYAADAFANLFKIPLKSINGIDANNISPEEFKKITDGSDELKVVMQDGSSHKIRKLDSYDKVILGGASRIGISPNIFF